MSFDEQPDGCENCATLTGAIASEKERAEEEYKKRVKWERHAIKRGDEWEAEKQRAEKAESQVSWYADLFKWDGDCRADLVARLRKSGLESKEFARAMTTWWDEALIAKERAEAAESEVERLKAEKDYDGKEALASQVAALTLENAALAELMALKDEALKRFRDRCQESNDCARWKA